MGRRAALAAPFSPTTRIPFWLGCLLAAASLVLAPLAAQEREASKEPAAAKEPAAVTLRAGMIGLDTSHVPAFAKLFNGPKAVGDLAGVKVVAGYPGGTDFGPSKTRVAKFTEDLRGMGIEIVDSIPKLLERVDVVLLESVDGRIHWEEARQVIQAGKPLFIDKPLAGSLADAVAIATLAERHKVPCFSSSSVRFGGGLQELKRDAAHGGIAGAITWGPCSYQEGTPDLFFYGVHGVDALFELMGPGCQSVARLQTDDADVVTGTWANGRTGTYRGLRRHKADFGAVVFGVKAIVPMTKGDGYEPLCREIAKFFKTGAAPVPLSETVEVFAFMEAADESKKQGGAPVSIADVMAKAKAAAAEKLKQ
jgi:predicted dehydrogenase